MLKKILALVVTLYAAMALAAVDVNKASEAELDNVKGVGPATSKLIMAERKKAPFKDWNDFISRVKGVGESRAAKLSEDGLTVNGSAYKAAAASARNDKQATKKDSKAAPADTKAAPAARAAAADDKTAAGKSSAAGAKPAASSAPAVAAAPAPAAASAAKK